MILQRTARLAILADLVVNGSLAVLAAIVGFLLAGPIGLWSGLLGAVIAGAFGGLTAFAAWLGVRVSKGDPASPAFYGVFLGGWFVKLVVFIVLLLLLRGMAWIQPKVFGVTLLVGVVLGLGADVWALIRARGRS